MFYKKKYEKKKEGPGWRIFANCKVKSRIKKTVSVNNIKLNNLNEMFGGMKSHGNRMILKNKVSY